LQFEVVEDGVEWVVCSDGVELARFRDQGMALNDVAIRLKTANPEAPARLSVRYSARKA